MGWSEKLPSGRFRAAYRDRRGGQRYLPGTYSSQAEAKRAAAAKEASIRRAGSTGARAGKIHWGKWCDEWMAGRAIEPSTRKRNESVIRQYLMPHWEGVPLENIDRDAVLEWVKDLKKETIGVRAETGEKESRLLAPRTVMKIFNVFSSSMKGAVVAQRIDASPCVGVALEKPGADDEYFMEREEVDRLIESSRGDLLKMIIRFGVGTGLRWGEIAGIHRARVSIRHQRIIVQEVYDKDNGEIKPYPKGKKRRGIPITAELAAELDKWMQDHPALPCRAVHRDGTRCRGALLFPSRAGTPLNYGNVRRRLWDQAVVAAGIEGATPHDMRHTYASWLIQEGAGIETVSALLGHASIETTQRYAHLAETQWGRVRGILDPSTAPTGLSEDAIRAAVAQLAEAHPGRWAAVAEALTGAGTEEVAPYLLHPEPSSSDGKIIAVDFRRRSTGS